MTNFKPIDDLAVVAGYPSDAGLLDRVRANQQTVWQDVGDTVIQQLDRVARVSWEWAVIWAVPWFWYPGDKSVEAALLVESLFDADGSCQVELCFVFTELSGAPSFDIGVESYTLIKNNEILEITTPEYRFSTPKFGFLQLWMRSPNEPVYNVHTSSLGPKLISSGGESARTGDIDIGRRQIRDFDGIVGGFFSGFDPLQLVIALNTTGDLGGSFNSGTGEFWRANVCGYGQMFYWALDPSPPIEDNAFFVDRAPPEGLNQYTYTVWGYAGIKPQQIGLRLNRHGDRGWFTARTDQIQPGQTQTQIAFRALTEGDRALYGMRRPWGLWYEEQVGGATSDAPQVRLYPLPRHADRLRHRIVCLAVAWETYNRDVNPVNVTLTAQMAEPNEGTGLLLYGYWSGTTEAQAYELVVYHSDLDWTLGCWTLPPHAWKQLVDNAAILSCVWGRDPGDPGVALTDSGARPYLLRLSVAPDRPRVRARVVCGSIWSEEV